MKEVPKEEEPGVKKKEEVKSEDDADRETDIIKEEVADKKERIKGAVR